MAVKGNSAYAQEGRIPNAAESLFISENFQKEEVSCSSQVLTIMPYCYKLLVEMATYYEQLVTIKLLKILCLCSVYHKATTQMPLK